MLDSGPRSMTLVCTVRTQSLSILPLLSDRHSLDDVQMSAFTVQVRDLIVTCTEYRLSQSLTWRGLDATDSPWNLGMEKPEVCERDVGAHSHPCQYIHGPGT